MSIKWYGSKSGQTLCPYPDPEGGGGGQGGPDPPPHPEKSQNIGFPSNTGPDPLKITNLPSQHSMLGHGIGMPAKREWRFTDGPMMARAGG